MSDLKKCPVCGSSCFSDMDVCYGCLHRFGSDEALIGVEPKLLSGALPAGPSFYAQGEQTCLPAVEDSSKGNSAGAVLKTCATDCSSVKEKAPSFDEGCGCKFVEQKDCDFAQIEITVRIPKDMSLFMGRSVA
ncbi:MAG: hypothetical protein Q4A43_02780 [Coriobacteriia bacterium]|nr:hypothetical protein [Coriobacteriia bacterium]